MKTKMKTLLILLLVSSALTYCGGGKKSATFEVTPPSGSVLFTADTIEITFSKGMKPDSVVYSGSMGSDAQAQWSESEKENDTLTIAPNETWDASKIGELVVTVKDSDNKDVEIDLSYFINLKLTTFQEASLVIGQPDFETLSDITEITNSSLGTSWGNKFVDDEGRLFINDFHRHRVLGFNQIPTTNGASADFVIGQSNFTSNDPGLQANQLNEPMAVYGYQGKLLIANYGANSIHLFNTTPTSNGASANIIIGQTGFGLDNNDCTNATLDGPESVIVVDGKLIVADGNNNRILVWNELPTTNNAPANLVVGQTTFTNCDDNQGGAVSASSIFYPAGVWSDGKKLIVNDNGNHRILIWNSFPTTNGQEADLVVGQPNLTSSAENADEDGNAGAVSSSSLFYPYQGLTSNGSQLFVADSGNRRLLIWNTFPTQNHQAADLVLGQEDMESAVIPIASNTRFTPVGVFIHKNKLLVTDNQSYRVLVFEGQ